MLLSSLIVSELPLFSEVLINFVHKFIGGDIVLVLLDIPSIYTDGKIFSHDTLFNSFDGCIFKNLGELGKFIVVIELCSVGKTSGPCEDGGNWVCGCWLSLLPLSIMSCDCTMSSFGFYNSIFVQEDRSHETERSITLSYNITLHITIVVLACPYKTTTALQNLSNHIINKSVFVINSLTNELFLVFFLINFLEDILEPTIISFQDGVFG